MQGTLLFCPDFENPFHLDADGSKNQLGGMTRQGHDMIVYHSRILTECQENHFAPEKEA